MSQAAPSSSTRPPRSIAELAKAAQQYPYDGSRSLKEILIGASQLRKQGEQYERDGDLESAFIFLARAATIVVEKLPNHVNFRDLKPEQRHNLKLNGDDIVAKLGDLKPTLSDRYEKYHSRSTDAAAAAERVRLAREAQAREREREALDPVKIREEENAAARQRAALRAEEDRRRQEEEDRVRRQREEEERRRRAEEDQRRRRAEEEERQRRAAEEAKRQEELARQQNTWDLSLLRTNLPTPGAESSPAITYRAPARKDDDFVLPLHPLEHPATNLYLDAETHSRTLGITSPSLARAGAARSNSFPPPITTTSPPTEFPQPIQYPTLMTVHQRQQGYTPSLQSIFRQEHPAPTTNSLLFSGPLYSHPLPAASTPYAPQQTPNVIPAPSHTHSYAPPPPRPAAPKVEVPSRDHSLSGDLKPVVFPREVLPRFLSIASLNTTRNRETCGLLLGRPVKGTYVVTTLLIPKQHSTSDTCTMDAEELVVEFQMARDLLTLGWIHTHPTQSCFMSSVDLHTHASFQGLLPESFAVVCAPKSKPNFGIFRLTDPPGLQVIKTCKIKESFHPHPDVPIYTDADKGHVQMQDLPLEIADLR